MSRIGVRHSQVVLCLFLLCALFSCSPEHGESIVDPVTCQPSRLQSDVTVATYNIHSGTGRDGKRDLRRIVDVLRDVEVAGLQEVDNGRIRSGFDNQTRTLAAELGRQYWQHFPAEDYWPLGTYGNAAISSYPIVASGVFDLPQAGRKPLRRLAWIKLLADCRPLHVFILHLTQGGDSRSSAQAAQAQAAWQAIVATHGTALEPVILMGDFNAALESPALRWLQERMVDVVETRAPHLSGIARLDHILVRGLTVSKVEVRDRGASDHPAVVATLQWR
jgi:endonuclease/exonuclease/phosphatase family metal-dependent hydrolase